jgi:DNA-binding MarR family transcriptional regulator
VHNDDADTWRRLTLLVARVTDSVDKALQRRHGLSLSEFLVLQALSEAAEGSLRMQALADAVGLDQSSVSRLITRLGQQGWAERCVCEQDRRGVFGRITDLGHEKVVQVLPTFQEQIGVSMDKASFDSMTASVVARLRYSATDVA